MPTGYTADIKDGIDFKTYAMNCARAFGACIMLRDEPFGGDQIPAVFMASDYHAKAAAKARADIEALVALSPEDRDIHATKAWETAEASRLSALRDNRDLRAAYEAMLEKVDSWKPPTPDHVGLHEFMRKQIKESIEWDCDETYYSTPPPRLTGEQWYTAELSRLCDLVHYHDKSNADEVNRAESNTKWVQALRESLGEPT